MKIKKIISTLFVLSFLFLSPLAAKAAAADLTIIKNTNPNYADGSYQLDDVQNMVVELSNVILQVVSVLTFVMFIYGGVLFLISAGNVNSVKKAKKIIIAAIIGLLIVFVSYTAVQFFIETLTDVPEYQLEKK